MIPVPSKSSPLFKWLCTVLSRFMSILRYADILSTNLSCEILTSLMNSTHWRSCTALFPHSRKKNELAATFVKSNQPLCNSFPYPLHYSIDLHPWHRLMEACVQPRQTGQLWNHSCRPDTTGWEYLKPSCWASSSSSCSSLCDVSSFCSTSWCRKLHLSFLTSNQEMHVWDVSLRESSLPFPCPLLFIGLKFLDVANFAKWKSTAMLSRQNHQTRKTKLINIVKFCCRLSFMHCGIHSVSFFIYTFNSVVVVVCMRNPPRRRFDQKNISFNSWWFHKT